MRSSRGLPLAVAALAAVASCGLGTQRETPPPALTVGDPLRGADLVRDYGCTSCHQLSDGRGPVGRVGPPLDGVGARQVIAGRLPNTPGNLQAWIRDPQEIVPGSVMPDLGVTEVDARDITAYLYTLR